VDENDAKRVSLAQEMRSMNKVYEKSLRSLIFEHKKLAEKNTASLPLNESPMITHLKRGSKEHADKIQEKLDQNIYAKLRINAKNDELMAQLKNTFKDHVTSLLKMKNDSEERPVQEQVNKFDK